MENINCLFCDSKQMEPLIVLNSRFWFVIRENSPVEKGHTLVILKRHYPDMFNLSWPEWRDLQDIIEHAKINLDDEFYPDGYNAGVNSGRAAGQTVFHLHIHLIPRYNRDVENPQMQTDEINSRLFYLAPIQIPLFITFPHLAPNFSSITTPQCEQNGVSFHKYARTLR